MNVQTRKITLPFSVIIFVLFISACSSTGGSNIGILTGKKFSLQPDSYIVGEKIKPGIYDITAKNKEQVAMVSIDTKIFEAVGQGQKIGVPKLRVILEPKQKIVISQNEVILTKVKINPVKNHGEKSLYAGEFIVGQDIGAGKYKIVPPKNQLGIIKIDDRVNELIGSNEKIKGKTETIKVDLKDGDIVKIVSISEIDFIPIGK